MKAKAYFVFMNSGAADGVLLVDDRILLFRPLAHASPILPVGHWRCSACSIHVRGLFGERFIVICTFTPLRVRRTSYKCIFYYFSSSQIAIRTNDLWIIFIGILCFSSCFLSPFRQVTDDQWDSSVVEYTALNITGFRIVDKHRRYVREFLDGWKRLDPSTSVGAGKETISVSSRSNGFRRACDTPCWCKPPTKCLSQFSANFKNANDLGCTTSAATPASTIEHKNLQPAYMLWSIFKHRMPVLTWRRIFAMKNLHFQSFWWRSVPCTSTNHTYHTFFVFFILLCCAPADASRWSWAYLASNAARCSHSIIKAIYRCLIWFSTRNLIFIIYFFSLCAAGCRV